MAPQTPAQRLHQVLLEIERTRGRRQAEVSRAIGFDQGYVSKVRRGKTQQVSDRVLTGLRMVYGVNPDWVKTGEGERFLGGGADEASQPDEGEREWQGALTTEETWLVTQFRLASTEGRRRLLAAARDIR